MLAKIGHFSSVHKKVWPRTILSTSRLYELLPRFYKIKSGLLSRSGSYLF